MNTKHFTEKPCDPYYNSSGPEVKSASKRKRRGHKSFSTDLSNKLRVLPPPKPLGEIASSDRSYPIVIDTPPPEVMTQTHRQPKAETQLNMKEYQPWKKTPQLHTLVDHIHKLWKT